MNNVIKFPSNMIEYKGDFYTPEELAEKLGITEFELVSDVEDNWFQKALRKLEEQ